MHPCTKLATALALVAGVTTARAAVVTVSDCSASPVARAGKKTVINRPGDDVVIRCALLPLDGTQRVEVVANSIAMDASIQNCGPKNGRFTVTGSACQVGGATLLDDEPDAQPTLTCAVSGSAIQLGTCDN